MILLASLHKIMWFKYPIVLLLFLIAALFQASFLPYFGIMTIAPNILFILFFVIIFLKKEKDYYFELFVVVIAGFCMDIFSNSYLGVSIISLFILYLFIQFTQYLFQERQDEYFVGYFVISFLVSLFAYGLFTQLLSNPLTAGFNIGIVTIVQILYNLTLALFFMYVYEETADFLARDRQLKLL